MNRPLLSRLLSSRPVAKGLRMLYRHTRPPAQRHNAVLWPFVRVQRDPAGRLSGCALRGATGPGLLPLAMVARRITAAAHLILSGPSVARIDYDQCVLETVMGVNGSIAVRQRHPRLRFDYYAMLDAGFVRHRRDLVAQVLSQDLLLFVTPEVYRWIAFLFDARRIRCSITLFEEVHQRAQQPRAEPDALARELEGDAGLVLFDAHHPEHAHGFSLDPPRGLFGGGTVAYTALQLLAWLGAPTVYLHGLDLTSAGGPRFYEHGGPALATALDRQFDGHIEPAFRRAAALLAARGVKVYNLSEASRLGPDVFEKRHWHCLLPPGTATGTFAESD
ncbi:hypothetical protein [Achromobacter xylosoxidans]|uniref:Lipopolysaccharide core biosynthesis protein n=1 Tax=Alcaligenes xylosoxydans xylosoxydans TaxID=85698 RepID=A0A1R1K272_ALCXX|nr:hypothetical protein [Achromobacter xylosoxidans]OMG93494.1 hypothetical protein BIZ92_03990 [Achromobacter xylosoxidans]BEG77229.1 hypothetical protein HBIAX_04316 [Achromobacter xylosoxidans]